MVLLVYCIKSVGFNTFGRFLWVSGVGGMDFLLYFCSVKWIVLWIGKNCFGI